jgi:hypothetical protein
MMDDTAVRAVTDPKIARLSTENERLREALQMSNDRFRAIEHMLPSGRFNDDIIEHNRGVLARTDCGSTSRTPVPR